MSTTSKEALDLGVSKGRARKEGFAWESKIMVNTATHVQSTSTMRNAEIQVGKKADQITPKQSPSAATSSKIKTVHRSDLGLKKSPPQIKRARSATITNRVRNEITLVKLRKLKSDSASVSVAARDSKLDDETVGDDSSEDLGNINSTFEEDNQVENADQSLDLELEDEEEMIEEEEVEKEIEIEVAEKSLEIKDITINLQEEKPEKLAIEEKKLHQSNDRSPPLTPIVKERAPPSVNHAIIQAKQSRISDHHHGASSRLQSLADLIMWRDVSRSAFVFGIGAFAIISSSYTKDLNISCISVLSYLGLVYLALSFMFRSLITRGNIDMDSREKEEYVVGEEEAVWIIKLVLPYLNEFLSKLRRLFSGDPATTMKLAVVLFILARCGGSITIFKMTKLGFFGVFIVPKLYSSYSSYIAAYGMFWIERFGDAWESCSHKKGVAFAIFSVVWNMSSVVARIWTVFVLFVAYRYYQQCRIKEEPKGFQEECIPQNQTCYQVPPPKSNIILPSSR